MTPKGLHSYLESARRNPPFHTGKLSPLHSSEGIPPTHDKTATHTEPLVGCLPPTSAFTYRECLCIYVCVTDSNLYHATLPSDRKKTMVWVKQVTEKKQKWKSGKGHKNMLVSSSYATNVFKWLMGRFSVLNDLPYFLCQKSLSPWILGIYFCSASFF